MNRKCPHVALLAVITLSLLGANRTAADWILLDDFQSYPQGQSIDGQSNGSGEWISPAYYDFFVIDVDPQDATNQVLSVLEVDSGEKQVYLDDDRIDIPDGQTGTWFARFYRGDPTTHVNFGLSDLITPDAWASFESQFRDQLGVAAARDGAQFINFDNDEVWDGLPEGEWINLWVVANNEEDTNEYYLQSATQIPTQIKLEAFGNDQFLFRNGTEDPLTTFLLRINNEAGAYIHVGPWYLDDLYLDPTGANLTSPLQAGIVGDFDGSGVLDAADIDALTVNAAGGLNPPVYDLNGDALVNEVDIKYWISDLYRSWVGDANLNGEFNSGDLVVVLSSGTYEADVDAVWSTGDFNGDGRNNSSDLVAALSDGGYEAGPRAAALAPVPEPATATLLIGAGIVFILRSRR